MKIKLFILVACIPMFFGCDSAADKGAVTTVAKCKVNDADIATSYSGECKDGLAQGKGVAKGRDVYQGEFDKGDAHGYGIYTWGENSDWASERWEGWQYRGERTGYGVSSVAVGSKNIASYFYQKNGRIEGDRYIIRGLWMGGELVQKCNSENECFKEFPGFDITKYRKIFSKSGKLFTMNRFRSVMNTAFSGFDTFGMGTGQCISNDVFDRYIQNHPRKAILDTNEAIDLLSILDDKQILFSIAGNCIHKVKSGKSETKQAIDPYQLVDIDELKVDINSLVSEKIKVQGVGVYIMDSFLLKRASGDASIIMVDQKRLTRNQKIRIIKECSMNIILGCPIGVSGTIGNVGIQNGIIAEDVEFEKANQ